MMRNLMELTGGEEKRCVFKLLTTASLRLFSVQKDLFVKDQVLEMDEYIPETGGFTTKHWSTKVGRYIKAMNDDEMGEGMAE